MPARHANNTFDQKSSKNHEKQDKNRRYTDTHRANHSHHRYEREQQACFCTTISKHLFEDRSPLLHQNCEVAKLGAFVCKGFLRSYVIDNKGKEHVIQFAPETWWISDKLGMAEGALATYFIDAIEDSEVLTVDLRGHLTMVQKIPGYAESFQKGMQKRTAAKDARIVHSLTSTAEERYDDFLTTYPTIAQRVPQHMLASYLGITPETLSRIRKVKTKRR